MDNFIFENTTKTFFGKGCVREYLCCLTKGYGRNVMLVCGDDSTRKDAVCEEVAKSLEKAGKNVVGFSGIMANPTYTEVLEGAKIARENGIDLILGVGGGGVMDCCKAISMAAVYEGDVWKDFFARPGIMEFEPLPVGAVPTEAGTGSEMNGSAAIINKERKVKIKRDYPKCSPKFALLDPAYTCGVPRRRMVSGGFDMLSHIMEVYFSAPDQDNVSDDIAEGLMKNVIRNLRAAAEEPENYTARSNLMWDAAMAGNRIIQLGKRTDFECHNMEYQLEAYTDCDHGEGLAVLHPVYYRHIYRHGLSRFRRFAVNVWGIPEEEKTEEALALAGVEALADFIREIGLPASLRELGIGKETDLKEIADSCGISAGSYKRMTHREIFEIFQECL